MVLQQLFGALLFVYVVCSNNVNVVAQGTGCQQELTKYCPGWETNVTFCKSCIHSNFAKLEANCSTLSRALAKCGMSPSPTPSPPPSPPDPPAPPAPPVPPRPGAPRPHVLLWVVDDQGFANIGFHNPFNVITPHADSLVKEGLILDRHYTFRWCAPTRSSLMTGRLPIHVFQHTSHVYREFEMLPMKLKQVGYKTHQVGKWHLGFYYSWMTPVGRGYDTSLGYLGGGEDHYTQQSTEFGCDGVDLYQSVAPAYGLNGTYAAYTYNNEAVRIATQHNLSDPLFMYVALQCMHAPQEVPEKYSNMYNSNVYSDDYAIMNGMATIADEVLGNVTSVFKARGMWENTLLIYTSDNGGPAGELASGHSGNNFPLRGGKTNVFEGGIRVTAFLSGGLIPASVRGEIRTGYIHVSDWYPTVIGLAGGDPTNNAPGLPPVDGYDMWPYITGKNDTSPRVQFMISSEPNPYKKNYPIKEAGWNGALISGNYKLILGLQTYAFWQAPNYPNSSTNHKTEKMFDCGSKGCLFDIINDPSEYHDLADTMPDKLKEMQEIFARENATVFEAPKVPSNVSACEIYRANHKGFVGPYLDGSGSP
eukprot:m.17182 g.17182  ORF g.17182 m.17182 type:complete len:590 (+) comp5927_c0_seq2:58-1827(+)